MSLLLHRRSTLRCSYKAVAGILVAAVVLLASSGYTGTTAASQQEAAPIRSNLHRDWISPVQAAQLNDVAHLVLSHDDTPDNRAFQWAATLKAVTRAAAHVGVSLPAEIGALNVTTRRFLRSAGTPEVGKRQAEWVSALVRAVEACAARGVMLNTGFSADSPDLFYVLSTEPVPVDVSIAGALNTLFGDEDSPIADALYWMDHGHPQETHLGTTIGRVGFINRKRINRKRKERAQRTQLVISNEAAHIALNRRYPRSSLKEWPLEALGEGLSLSFEPNKRHVRELISDIISMQISQHAFEFRMRSVFDEQIVRRDNEIFGNPDKPYGVTAVSLANSLRHAARSIGDDGLIDRVEKFLHLAAEGNYHAGKRAIKKLDDEAFRAAVIAHQIELGKFVIDNLDETFTTE